MKVKPINLHAFLEVQDEHSNQKSNEPNRNTVHEYTNGQSILLNIVILKLKLECLDWRGAYLF